MDSDYKRCGGSCFPGHRNYCLCGAGGLTIDDFFGADAKYQQDAGSQCIGAQGGRD
jgi:hypothetical protein